MHWAGGQGSGRHEGHRGVWGAYWTGGTVVVAQEL